MLITLRTWERESQMFAHADRVTWVGIGEGLNFVDDGMPRESGLHSPGLLWSSVIMMLAAGASWLRGGKGIRIFASLPCRMFVGLHSRRDETRQ